MSVEDAGTPAVESVRRAAARLGLPVDGLHLVRAGSNNVLRLPGGRIARLAGPDRWQVAEREVRVARWLAGRGIPAVTPLPDLPQPTDADGSPLTWWSDIGDHRPAELAELGLALRALHRLPPPPFALPDHDPAVGVETALQGSPLLGADRRAALLRLLADSRTTVQGTAPFAGTRVIHGDAWQGNVAVDGEGTAVLLDLERVAVGDPAWDLLPVAVDHADFARIDGSAYREFVSVYGGSDVTTWPGFRAAATLQELRWLVFLLRIATGRPELRGEVSHRVACLLGEVTRPWTWQAQ